MRAQAPSATPTPPATEPASRPLSPPARPWWKPVWSVPAAMRAVRSTIVIPGLFAITSKVIGDPQMALFATFGGFAALILTSFGGSRTDKLRSHFGLAVVGSIALIIGTLVSGTTWLAAVVTVPVVFAIFFAGVLGPTPAGGTTGALLAYVLPVASAGGATTIGSRLEGWWLASAAATLAVLLLSPRSPADRLRAAAAELAAEISGRLAAAADGEATDPAGMRACQDRLRAAFTGAPFRPTGMSTADQGLTSAVTLLDWASEQVADAFDGHIDLTRGCTTDRALLRAAGAVFADIAALLSGRPAEPDFAGLERAKTAAAAYLRDLPAALDEPDTRVAAAQAVHAQSIAVAARAAAADALIAARRADPATIAAERRSWYGPPLPLLSSEEASQSQGAGTPPRAETNGLSLASSATSVSLLTSVAGATGVVARHASVRSVWFTNSLRAAVGLAAAVAVADLTGVQHGFWVVLGTLSVLRTNASGTTSSVLRALAGTVIGFAVGAALLLAIGTGQTSMWVALPVATLIAAYAPGTTPFAVGQAAFTIVVVVLFNLIVPIGWKVGLLRIEDVALGCAVSFAVGAAFWPRGAGALVGDDLADAFRAGADYLTQAVDWALSERMVPPAAASAAVTAGLRLDDGLRGFLAEQGAKRASKEDLWSLVTATTRLRLTANTLAGLRHVPPEGQTGEVACLPLEDSGTYAGTPACVSLRSSAADLAGFYQHVAGEVGRPGHTDPAPAVLPAPPQIPGAVPGHAVPGHAVPGHAVPGHAVPGEAAARDGVPGDGSPRIHPHLLWVQEHLHHLSESAQTVSEPAVHVAQARRSPWWR